MTNCWTPVENLGKGIRSGTITHENAAEQTNIRSGTITHENAAEQTKAMNDAMNSDGIS